MTTLKTLTASDLSQLLRRSVSTIKADAQRRPETLPPRLVIPGSSRLLWLEDDVIAWVNNLRRQEP
jgi:hypothetical protein